MKKKLIALVGVLAVLLGVVSVSIFASLSNSSGDGASAVSDIDVTSAIVAGYAANGKVTVDGALNASEGWVLNGSLGSDDSFGAQWYMENGIPHLYLAVASGDGSRDDVSELYINGEEVVNPEFTYSVSTYNEKYIGEMGPLNISAYIEDIDSYDQYISISITLTGGGSYSGYLKLSSVNWWLTSNISNSLHPSGIGAHLMRGIEVDGLPGEYIGGNKITNGFKVFDRYSGDTLSEKQIGSRIELPFCDSEADEVSKYHDGMSNRDRTVYFSFDFQVDSMPVYNLAEALGGYQYTNKVANYGFTWRMGDGPVTDANGDTWSNVTMGGIVNTEEGLYLNICGDYNSVLKLNKTVGSTFNIGIGWHSNGDVSVYIDGVKKGYFANATRYMKDVIDDGVYMFTWRDEVTPVTGSEDNIEITVTNMAFGSALPESPVEALRFADILNGNNSAEEVTTALTLPTVLNKDSVSSGVNVNWTSSNPTVVAPDGTVTRPATGAAKVTLTASDGVNQKTFDVIVLGENHSSVRVMAVEGDINPGIGAAKLYSGNVFHFDSNNNSLVYDMVNETRVNVIKLTDIDNVSRLNRESVSIWVSDDNVKYTRLEDNFKLLHSGNNWYLYDFEATTRYVKVNYTLFDTVESDFTNVMCNIMSAYAEDVFGANTGSFSNKTVTVTNTTAKDQQDYPWRISAEGLGINNLTKIRVKLGDAYLYHYVDGSDIYVRIPDLAKDATAELTVYYGNPNALDSSDKEAVYEVTYGTKEMYAEDTTNRYLYTLKAGTVLGNGDTLEKDVLLCNRGYTFDLSYDGGVTWTKSGSFRPDDFTGVSVHAHGGYIFDNGRLYWRSSIYASSNDNYAKGSAIIVYSDNGGLTWENPKVVVPQTVDGKTFTSYDGYTNGVVLSNSIRQATGVDYVFPVAGFVSSTESAGLFIISKDDGANWTVDDTCLYLDSEQGSEGGLTESTLLENESGQLVWYCRNQTNQVVTFATATATVTADGLDWSKITSSSVFGTNTQPVLNKIDGDPILVWGGNNAFGGHSYNRMPLSFAVSYNGLTTFRNIQNAFSETFLEDYTQTELSAFITNPSVVKWQDELLVAYYTNTPGYKVFTRLTDFENWFYRTKGIYDSFDGQNTKYEGWITYMGGTSISDTESSRNYALQIAPNGVVSRSVPYLQNGTVSLDVLINAQSDFTIELQSAFTPMMNECAPITLRVSGGQLTANGTNIGPLTDGWRTITVNLGLAKTDKTASVCLDENDPVAITPVVSRKDNAGTEIPMDYVCYIAVSTGEATVCVDNVLVLSNLDAINYDGVISAPTVGITTQPTDREATVGETATYSVEAQGYGRMYQWYVSDDGENWTEIVGATSASYITDALTIEDTNNQYKCLVLDRNENSAESSAAKLTVNPFVGEISLDIGWDSMEFTYTDRTWNAQDHSYSGGKWSSTSNSIFATNKSNVDLEVTVTYEEEAGYGNISGSFDEDNTPHESTVILNKAENPETPDQEGGTASWILSLNGEPTGELERIQIGSVTIIVQQLAE